MNKRTEYDIHISSLKGDEYSFQYTVDELFLEKFGYHSTWKDFSIRVDAKLKKGQGFFEILFTFYGTIHVNCDRCMANLPLELWDEFTLLVKYVNDPDTYNQKEEDPFVYYISFGTDFFNISQWLYDFYLLCIPIVKQCSAEEFEKKTYCDENVLKRIQNLE